MKKINNLLVGGKKLALIAMLAAMPLTSVKANDKQLNEPVKTTITNADVFKNFGKELVNYFIIVGVMGLIGCAEYEGFIEKKLKLRNQSKNKTR